VSSSGFAAAANPATERRVVDRQIVSMTALVITVAAQPISTDPVCEHRRIFGNA